ncbi:MAG: epimerase [Bacteroidota bacterium]|nr:epimerase [Bacteroidota bacterium]MDP4249503.1 epimerase [Bacteroidota bacterium]
MATASLRVILTGATGMVGEAVLHECLLSPEVETILLISRKSCALQHPKLREILQQDFMNLLPIESQLKGYNACFFCLGVSSVGMDKALYEKLTYNLTMGFAAALVAQNPEMVFCYISGRGTDSTEKGKMHWARVKGKTENDLQKLPFKAVYNFRPGIMKPTKGLKNTLAFYKWAGWLLPIISAVAPHYVISLADLGQAMIHAAARGYEKSILEIRDIEALSASA